MRFDGTKYRDCRWCRGNGCLYCESECDAEYKRQFPGGPKPIASFSLNTPGDVDAFKEIFGREAMEKAFGAEGGGLAEILVNLTKKGTGQ